MAHYWPVLLIAVGVALLANSLRSVLLGWVATILVIGALGFGAWWAYHHGTSTKPSYTKTLDLGRPRAETLTIRARVFGGSLEVESKPGANGKRTLELFAEGVGGEAGADPHFISAAGAAILDWPSGGSHVYQAPIGGDLRISAPEQLRIRLEAKSLFSGVRADFGRLRPERCEVEAIGSAVRILAPGPSRPALVRIRGTLSNVDLLIPSSCPVRLEFLAPLTFRSIPEDFTEHLGGRSKTKIWTSEGSGPLLLIRVEGPLIHLRVRREPVRAL